jgi:hypothetical protein
VSSTAATAVQRKPELELHGAYRLGVMSLAVVVGRPAVLAVCIAMSVTIAPWAGADPISDPAPNTALPAGDERVPSGDPTTVNAPDGWTLAIGAKDE